MPHKAIRVTQSAKLLTLVMVCSTGHWARSAQVHQHGGDALATGLWARIDGIIEEVVMRVVLLPVLEQQSSVVARK